MKNNKNGKILNVLLGIIALLAIIFIIFWLISKNNNVINTNNNFNENLQKMQETAKEYFKDKLPENIGDTTIMYLDEMIENDLSEEITYGKITCDKNLSYISITKSNDNEYKVKSNLVCGNVSDNIIEKINSKLIITNEDNNVTNEKNENNSTSCECDDNGKIDCKVTEIPTTCTTEYTYEFVKYNVSCPDGYILNNNECIKYSNDVISATENYSEKQTKVKDAIKNDGTYHKVYTDYIVSGGVETKYCEKGTLSGNYCYEYSQKITKTTETCPSGYVKEGNACYKYTDLIKTTESTCPSGYVKNNNACYKYADLIIETTESTCPSGYTKSGDTCYKTENPKKVYSSWGNPVSEWSTTTYQAPYQTDTEKLVLMGSNTIKGITTYNYALYRRTVSYSCTNGTLKNGLCYIYTNPIGGTTTSRCPSGYTRSGDICYIKTDLIVSTDSYCPTGYIRSGNNCYKKADLIVETTSYCPTDYTEENNICVKKSTPKIETTEKIYSCPSGYTKEGNNENTKCYKLVKSADTYYCEDEKATLKDNLCYYVEESKFLGYTCPYGYTLDNKSCYKMTSEKTNVIWGNPEYKYSKNSYLEGYQKTGFATFVTTCIEDIYNGQNPNTMK